MSRIIIAAGVAFFGVIIAMFRPEPSRCPELYERGVVDLDYNAAFLDVQEFSDGQHLTVTSFFNVRSIGAGPPSFFAPDLVARLKLDASASFVAVPCGDSRGDAVGRSCTPPSVPVARATSRASTATG